MKKKRLLIFILVFTILQVNAQRKRLPMNPGIKVTQTDALFAKPVTGMFFRHQLRIVAQNKTVIEIHLQNMEHLQAIRNIDSILAAVWNEIQPLKDSFPNDANNRLLDINTTTGSDTKMRIVTYTPRGSNFVKTNNGLAILKIEQDTLHILGAIVQERSLPALINTEVTALNPTGRGTYMVHIPWTITIVINNLSELPSLAGTLNAHMNSIAADYAPLTGYNRKNQYFSNVNLQYEPFSAFTGKDKYIVYKPYRSKYSFNVLVQSGVQNVQSGFAVSAGVGVGFSNIIMSRPGNSYFLAWEPYFFFDKNVAGKTVIQRNDFITFQYKSRFSRPVKDVDINLANNFSIGYLVHRDGDHFNRNTFKFGLPGLEFRNLQLQPQFIFNNLFKQFYPSLKLQVQID